MTEILNFFKELATTLTWPMAALIIAFMFRKQLFLAIKALTRRIETADKVSVTKDGLTLETLAKKVEAAEQKADDAQKDVESLAVTGVPERKPIEELIKIRKHNIVENIKDAPCSNDPQKKKWGGSPKMNNRELRARVTALGGSIPLYRIELEVVSLNPMNKLTGKVIFHLHDTFPDPVQEVEVVNGVAGLRLLSYGSFTVGAEADNGATKLELDLENVEGVTEHFKKT